MMFCVPPQVFGRCFIGTICRSKFYITCLGFATMPVLSTKRSYGTIENNFLLLLPINCSDGTTTIFWVPVWTRTKAQVILSLCHQRCFVPQQSKTQKHLQPDNEQTLIMENIIQCISLKTSCHEKSCLYFKYYIIF